ncbi:2-dehydropantoate 2-reductase [Atopobacter phocae]|uniref:2-dehydropantoate 2-reductase n=1 Tax=Atopobacter phocae TaxID=136492 RepID=UPI00046EC574|nr:2-dehydropantoate 2-reductase [Atopobacter phocae]
MLIYIAGAGAMGSRFGYQLHRAGQDVILLDEWDAHIQAIQTNGLVIEGDRTDTVHLPIMRPSEATQPADLVILLTKAMQLPQMLQSIQSVISEQTQVLCLLNGLGHEEVIEQYVPRDQIMMGVTIWTAGLKGPGIAHLAGTGAVNIQSLAANGKARAEEIVDVMNQAELNVTYDDDVIPSIWRKACVNGTMNSTCALLDCTIGELFASESGQALVNQIIHEFVVVGEAEGVQLNEEEISKYVYHTAEIAKHHHPSMHQDLVQNNRLTEIDFINGAVHRLAEKNGLAAPYSQQITQMIHAKENILGIK